MNDSRGRSQKRKTTRNELKTAHFATRKSNSAAAQQLPDAVVRALGGCPLGEKVLQANTLSAQIAALKKLANSEARLEVAAAICASPELTRLRKSAAQLARDTSPSESEVGVCVDLALDRLRQLHEPCDSETDVKQLVQAVSHTLCLVPCLPVHVPVVIDAFTQALRVPYAQAVQASAVARELLRALQQYVTRAEPTEHLCALSRVLSHMLVAGVLHKDCLTQASLLLATLHTEPHWRVEILDTHSDDGVKTIAEINGLCRPSHVPNHVCHLALIRGWFGRPRMCFNEATVDGMSEALDVVTALCRHSDPHTRLFAVNTLDVLLLLLAKESEKQADLAAKFARFQASVFQLIADNLENSFRAVAIAQEKVLQHYLRIFVLDDLASLIAFTEIFSAVTDERHRAMYVFLLSTQTRYLRLARASAQYEECVQQWVRRMPVSLTALLARATDPFTWGAARACIEHLLQNAYYLDQETSVKLSQIRKKLRKGKQVSPEEQQVLTHTQQALAAASQLWLSALAELRGDTAAFDRICAEFLPVAVRVEKQRRVSDEACQCLFEQVLRTLEGTGSVVDGAGASIRVLRHVLHFVRAAKKHALLSEEFLHQELLVQRKDLMHVALRAADEETRLTCIDVLLSTSRTSSPPSLLQCQTTLACLEAWCFESDSGSRDKLVALLLRFLARALKHKSTGYVASFCAHFFAFLVKEAQFEAPFERVSVVLELLHGATHDANFDTALLLSETKESIVANLLTLLSNGWDRVRLLSSHTLQRLPVELFASLNVDDYVQWYLALARSPRPAHFSGAACGLQVLIDKAKIALAPETVLSELKKTVTVLQDGNVLHFLRPEGRVHGLLELLGLLQLSSEQTVQAVRLARQVASQALRFHSGDDAQVDCRGHLVLPVQHTGHEQADAVFSASTWHGIRCACDLMVQLSKRLYHTVGDAGEAVAKETGDFLLTVLLQSKHNGAVGEAAESLRSLAEHVLMCVTTDSTSASDGDTDSESGCLTTQWWHRVMQVITVRRDADLDHGWIRRSAGLPATLLALLCAQPRREHTLLNETLRILIDTIRSEAKETAENYDHVRRVHALNCARAIFRDASLALDATAFVSDSIQVSMDGFSHPSWAVRNASLLLLSAVVAKVLRQDIDRVDADDLDLWERLECEHTCLTDESSPVSVHVTDAGGGGCRTAVTASSFFAQYPLLRNVLLDHMRAAFDETRTQHSARALFPVLLMLQRMRTALRDTLQQEDVLAPFRPLVLRCAAHKHIAIRSMAARALLSIVPPSTRKTVLLQQLQLVSTVLDQSANEVHGVLAQCLQLATPVTTDTDDAEATESTDDVDGSIAAAITTVAAALHRHYSALVVALFYRLLRRLGLPFDAEAVKYSIFVRGNLDGFRDLGIDVMLRHAVRLLLSQASAVTPTAVAQLLSHKARVVRVETLRTLRQQYTRQDSHSTLVALLGLHLAVCSDAQEVQICAEALLLLFRHAVSSEVAVQVGAQCTSVLPLCGSTGAQAAVLRLWARTLGVATDASNDDTDMDAAWRALMQHVLATVEWKNGVHFDVRDAAAYAVTECVKRVPLCADSAASLLLLLLDEEPSVRRIAAHAFACVPQGSQGVPLLPRVAATQLVQLLTSQPVQDMEKLRNWAAEARLSYASAQALAKLRGDLWCDASHPDFVMFLPPVHNECREWMRLSELLAVLQGTKSLRSDMGAVTRDMQRATLLPPPPHSLLDPLLL